MKIYNQKLKLPRLLSRGLELSTKQSHQAILFVLQILFLPGTDSLK